MMKRHVLALFMAAVVAGTLPGYAFAADVMEHTGEEIILDVRDGAAEHTPGVSGETTQISETALAAGAGALVLPEPEAVTGEVPETEYIAAEGSQGTATEGSAGQAEEDSAEEGAPGQADIAAPGSFILSIEEVETPGDIQDGEAPESETEEAETVYETETDILEEAGLASDASRPQHPFMLFSALTYTYTDSYGAQLSGNARAVYDAWVKVLFTDEGQKDLKITFPDPVKFSLEHPYNKDTWNKDKETDAGYQAGMDQVRFAVQSAYDALAYDYPQAYWLKAPAFSIANEINGNKITGTAKSVTLDLANAILYTDAFKDQSDFKAAVQSAVAEIQGGLPAGASQREKAKAIHDYLCKKIVYEKSNDFAHSAVGVFLKGGQVVCEGYAKSYKILCEEFGLECVLIVGYAGEAHMWNYVKMEDDNWYLVDATWDDQPGGILDTYFLAGANTKGFKDTAINEERIVYTNFSKSDTTTSFIIPVLSDKSYEDAKEAMGTEPHTHVWELKEEEKPTCKKDGFTLYQCKNCNVKSKVISSKGNFHNYEYVSDNNATCVADGTKTEVCKNCGSKNRTMREYGTMNADAHSFGEYIFDKNATCSAYGTKTRVCKLCGQKETAPAPEAGYMHSFETYKLNNDATCQAYGTKTRICKLCGQKETISAPEAGYAPHHYEYVSNGDATCTSDGTKSEVCTVCGDRKTEKIADPGSRIPHLFETYVPDGSATCQTYGTKTAVCAYGCGTRDTVEDRESGLKAHLYETYVSNNDATWKEDGTKTAECAYGCGTKDTVTDQGSKLTPRIEVNVSSLTLKTRQSTNVVTVSGLVRGDAVKSWTSSNTQIVKVNGKGKIAAQKKTGTATVRVTLESGISRAIKVKVQSAAVATKKISGISSRLTLKKGGTTKLKPVISPITSSQKVTYRSSNKKVVTVSASGKLKAKKKGTATITVKSGSVTVKCKVTVR